MEPVHDDEFFCRCKETDGDTQRNIRRCDEVIAETRRRIVGEDGWFTSISDENDLAFFESVLFAVAGEAKVSFMADQWWCVSVRFSLKDPKTGRYDIRRSSDFQCDEPLDGVCGAYLWMDDRKKEVKAMQPATTS